LDHVIGEKESKMYLTNAARDTTDDEPIPAMPEEEDDSEEERQAPNLSMDEVRELLDEFEEILHT
jgi:hypothetical protein